MQNIRLTTKGSARRNPLKWGSAQVPLIGKQCMVH